jgi:formiminoglutamate deiminase
VTAYWCEQAIVGDPSAGRVEPGVLVEESDGTITGIGVGTTPPPGSRRLRGIVLPGLANAHSHTFQRALRGVVERGGGDFWEWRDAMYALADALEPESFKELCGAAFAEMLCAGITTVGEFHYVHHRSGGAQYADPDAMTWAVVTAAETAGIRLSVIDACYLTGGIGEPLVGAQARFGDGNVERWGERIERFTPSEKVRLCAGAHSVRALAPTDIEFVATLARKQSLPLHFHLSEQSRENEQCLAAYGRTPTELLEDCGALGGSSVAVHATFVSETDTRRLGSSATTVCLCPSTEQNLGDGISPAEALARAGSPLAVGSDSNAQIDLFQEARGIELNERLATGRRAVHAPEALLASATSQAARALGWPEAGEIAVGYRCDLVVLDTSSPRLAGAIEADPVGAVVFAASASDVTDVFIDGRAVVEAGRHAAFAGLGGSLSRAIDELRGSL